MMAEMAPPGTEKLTSCSALTPPKRRLSCETSRRDAIIRRKTTVLRRRWKPRPSPPFLQWGLRARERTSQAPDLLGRLRRRSRRRRSSGRWCRAGLSGRRGGRRDLVLDALGHHPDGPTARGVADGVERLHGAHVLRLVVGVE